VDYYSKFGKDISKLTSNHREHKEYTRYKEFAFGGNNSIEDEGAYLDRKQITHWTYEEKIKFLDLYLEHGRDWANISENIPTKTNA
jgi:hypothetical protein